MMKKIFSTLRSYNLLERIFTGFLLVIFLFSFYKIFFSNASRSGDTYYEGLTGYVSVLNPLFVDFNEADREISRLIFSGLTKYDPAKKAIVADMATVKLDEAQRVYTFTLKDFLKWHDGHPVTADDAYFTFHSLIQSPKFTNPLLKANFQGVEIEKIDGKNIRFTLKKPNAFFMANMTVGLLPAHIFRDVPIEELNTSTLNEKPVGTGPYKISAPYRLGVDEEGEIELTRFTDYYGGAPRLKRIIIRTFPRTSVLLKNENALNGLARLSFEDMEIFKNDPDFKIFPYQLPQYTGLFLNTDRPFLQNKNVRLALQKALNKQELLKLLPGRTSFDTPLLELNQEDWVYKPNVEQARGALFDAGWKLNEENGKKIRRNKKGDILTLRLIAPEFSKNPHKLNEMETVLPFLEKSFSEIGVQVDIVIVPFESFSETVRSRDYDLLLAGQSLGYNFDTYYFWHSSQASSEGLNLSNYKSFKADAFIEEIRRTFDEKRKEDALSKLAITLGEDIPAIFLFRDTSYYVSDGTISALSFDGLAFSADRFANVVDWEKD